MSQLHSTASRSALPCVLAAAMALTLSSGVRADHIPGHSDDDPVFPVPIPGQEHFDGGAMWVTAVGPRSDSEVANARFDITYVSDGTTPASQLMMNVGLYVQIDGGEPTYVEVVVTGEDLGFGSGPGTFNGHYQTTELNGVPVESFLMPPYSTIDIIVGAIDGGIQGSGYFHESFINFDLATECHEDLTGDGTVDVADLLELLAAWGTSEAHADLDGDGVIGVGDLLMLLGAWGSC